MPVLVEAISVIIRMDAIETHYPGGWDSFEDQVPNQTLCADGDIARIGFMTPVDVEAYVKHLESLGFIYLLNGRAHDIAIVDQQHGPMAPCPWLECGRTYLDEEETQLIGACRLINGFGQAIAMPFEWTYEDSLSASFNFVPNGQEHRNLTFLRREDGVDVYLNHMTGREEYVARTTADPE